MQDSDPKSDPITTLHGDNIPGAHIVYTYSNPTCYLNNMIKFLITSLESGHNVLIVEQPDLYQKALATMKQRKFYFSDHRLQFIDNQEYYLQLSADNSLERLTQPFQDDIPIRVWGNVLWHSEATIPSYERDVDLMASKHHSLVVCCYDGEKLTAKTLLQLMKNHQYLMTDTELTPSTTYKGQASHNLFLIKEELENTIVDYDELQKQQARLAELEMISQTALRISHEVRNPLTAIKSLAQLAQQNSKPNPKFFSLIAAEIDRANSILVDFLSLGRAQVVHLSSTDLNEVIHDLSPILHADADQAGSTLMFELGPIPNVQLDGKRVKQVLLNLTKNSLEVMPQGGEIRISTSLQGKSVVLAVSDQGHGIPSEKKLDIFTPFFTTKEDGTGLGLPVCYSIMKAHGGDIDFQSGPQGTTFFLTFPAQIEQPLQ